MSQKIHLNILPSEINFLPMLKSLIAGSAQVSLSSTAPVAVTELVIRARERGATAIATTNPKALQLLLGRTGEKLPSLDEYQGSIFEKQGYEFLILPPLEQLFTVSYGKHIYKRYFSKIINPSSWLHVPEFRWELFQPARREPLLEVFQTSLLTAVDIETGQETERIITSVGFTAIHIDSGTKQYQATTVVVPLTDLYSIAFVKEILSTPAPKVFQNGKYDNAYFLRYGCTTKNWAFDTINLFHSWYSELPKDLGFLTSYLLRKWEYHKGESGSGDLMQDYQYNAKDSFSTAMDCITLLREMPTWAMDNYLMEFPVVFPCLLAEMTGIAQDEDRRKELKEVVRVAMELRLGKIHKMVSNNSFNPNSSQQTQKLFEILGSKDIKGTGANKRDKVASRHPLNKKLLLEIGSYRKEQKSASNVLKECSWHGRIFYALNPHGTDTFRLASKESQFWCGMQIQNIPRDTPKLKAKSMFISDPGFLFGEGDYRQNETWGTAFLSGDPELLRIIQDPSKDFHSYNAAAFFGLSYEELCKSFFDEALGEWQHERLQKEIIDIAKRTNHGSNYNMGATVMLDTMGIDNVLRAKRLLTLPFSWSLEKVCQYLLNKYAETYKVVKGPWYDKCKSDVMGSRFLVSPTNWHRYCFGDPTKNKHHLNSYVAHPPQNLAACILNKVWLKVFYQLAIPYAGKFKLCAQIHDSIWFQYRIGYEWLAWKVRELMTVTVPVTDIFGVTRNMTVPVDLKGGSNRWSDMKSLKHHVAEPVTNTGMFRVSEALRIDPYAAP